MTDNMEFRKVKALEDIVEYMRRHDDMMQSLLLIMQRIEDEVGH
jgi:hypothetical protein